MIESGPAGILQNSAEVGLGEPEIAFEQFELGGQGTAERRWIIGIDTV